MKVIKNINNNVSVCLDNNNQEVVVFGKGIGFIKPPYELEISKIQRTFYDIDENYVSMINLLPEEIIDTAMMIVDYARTNLDCLFNSNIVFTLADHINFAIKRYKENLVLKMPVYYDIQHLYEKEYKIGRFAVKLIEKKLKVLLPRDEIIGIALHIVNAEGIKENSIRKIDHSNIIEEITDIIETFFHIKIDKNGFNYSRFISHVQYLLRRGKEGKSISTKNSEIYDSLKTSFPEVHDCAKEVNKYLSQQLGYLFDDEELLYLMLHINRLCAREDCYQ